MNAILGGVVRSEVRWQRGSDQAFEALVHDRLDACYRLAAVLLGDRIEAEDATHEAIVRAQRSWLSLRNRAAAEAWLDRIVVNECRDRLRRRRVTRTVLAPNSTHPDRTVPTSGIGTEERAALQDALARLTPDHRVVVVLRYLLDLPIDAIAERIGAPAGTVKSRLHHAISELRAAYDAAARDVDR